MKKESLPEDLTGNFKGLKRLVWAIITIFMGIAILFFIYGILEYLVFILKHLTK